MQVLNQLVCCELQPGELRDTANLLYAARQNLSGDFARATTKAGRTLCPSPLSSLAFTKVSGAAYFMADQWRGLFSFQPYCTWPTAHNLIIRLLTKRQSGRTDALSLLHVFASTAPQLFVRLQLRPVELSSRVLPPAGRREPEQ